MDAEDFELTTYGTRYAQDQHTILSVPEVLPIEIKLLKADDAYGQDLLSGKVSLKKKNRSCHVFIFIYS